MTKSPTNIAAFGCTQLDSETLFIKNIYQIGGDSWEKSLCQLKGLRKARVEASGQPKAMLGSKTWANYSAVHTTWWLTTKLVVILEGNQWYPPSYIPECNHIPPYFPNAFSLPNFSSKKFRESWESKV